MKRLPAILFLLVLVFNFCGYQAILFCLERNDDAALQKKLDEQAYRDEDLVSIKISLNVPYYSNSPIFERATGSVTIKGIVYEYVKQRVYHDSLELLCIPNEAKTHWQQVGNELVKAINGEQACLPGKRLPATIKLSLPDFFQPWPHSILLFGLKEATYRSLNDDSFSSGFVLRLERPPQVV